MRLKRGEKFTEPDFKPRLYCVFDPVHTILTGPLWSGIQKAAKEVPGYVADCSHPEMVNVYNNVVLDLAEVNNVPIKETS